MKIGDLAKLTGLTPHTIRYYERIGLLPKAYRDASKRRAYDTKILAWIEFLARLKSTGMPLREMIRYAQLRQQGSETGRDRAALLAQHRDRVRARIADLQSSLLVLDAKIAGYAESEKRTFPHDKTPPKRLPLRGNQARPRQARTRTD